MKLFETPRPLSADAYTLGSRYFESNDALTLSEYYLTFRKFPNAKEPFLYDEDDRRIVFCGISTFINKLLTRSVTHKEIDQSVAFLRNRKYMSDGSLSDFDFPEKQWRRIVDEFHGFVPIRITSMPEGSVVYPNEPAVRVKNTVKGFGQFAAYFETRILNYCWSQTARLTAARHWLERNVEMVQSIEDNNYEEAVKLAQLMLTDFGDRSAMCGEESESLSLAHLLCFPGTDTFSGAFQAYMNGAPSYIGGSVWALAHRIVQGYVTSGACYGTMYDVAPNNSILSMVADCYDYKYDVVNYLIPLALRSKQLGNGKIIVARPDSGDAQELMLWTLAEATKAGLMETRKNGYKYGTTLKMIQGDSMNFTSMHQINTAMMAAGYAPHGCWLYGVGGNLRNSITRDDMSTKYALYSANGRDVIKQSEVEGKQTLPHVAVVRDLDNIHLGTTIRGILEKDDSGNFYGPQDKHILQYEYTPELKFPLTCSDDFNAVQSRVLLDFHSMPKNGGRISPYVLEQRRNILAQATGG